MCVPLVYPRGTLRLLLTDAPIEGDVSSVKVCFERVSVILDDEEEAPPITVALGIGTIDLLELQDGVTAMLGEAELPAGETVAAIRIVLCERGNTIVVDGVEHELVTPSGQQSGLKLKPKGGIAIREGTPNDAVNNRDLSDVVSVLRSYPYCPCGFDNGCANEGYFYLCSVNDLDGSNWKDFKRNYLPLFGQAGAMDAIEAGNGLTALTDF